MFEKHHAPLAHRHVFARRLLRSLALALVLVGGSLTVGAWGYHRWAGLSWLDAMLNAAMILTGMGPVDVVTTVAGKWFATGYALFSGVIFLTVAAVLLAPWVHRLLHTFHLD